MEMKHWTKMGYSHKMNGKTDYLTLENDNLYTDMIKWIFHYTAQKMKFTITDFFSKCDQIRSFLRIWSHLLKKYVMENFIFRVVVACSYSKMNFYIGIFQDFDCKFRGTYFPEFLSLPLLLI